MNDELVVLVPVLGRPARVAPLLASHRASGAPGRVLFLVNENDTEELEAIAATGTEDFRLVEPECLTWPQKINRGLRITEEPWILCAADDIRFHPGWWEATAVARKEEWGVIGTNDLGNRRVMSGEHTTHPLIARWYVDEMGTLDEKGKLAHEGYRHWYVDDEIVLTAKSRNEWCFCSRAEIVHQHPYWNPEVPWDATYERGQSSAKQDQRVWRQRQPQILKQWQSPYPVNSISAVDETSEKSASTSTSPNAPARTSSPT